MTKPLDLEQFEGHQPAPWEASREIHNDPDMAHEQDWLVWCEAWSNHICTDQYEADAKLIAAAPSLLAEVKALRKSLERLASMEAMTIAFMPNKKTNEGKELDARIDYARKTIGDTHE